MTMPNELDDLKIAWQTLDGQLQREHALTFQVFKENELGKFRRALLPLWTGQSLQLLCGVILSLIFAPFWIRQLGNVHLMIYGLSLHAYGLMFIGFAIRDFVLIKRIDYSAPIVTIQKQIAELRSWHVRVGWWFALAGCFIWTPFLLVIFYALGADLWLAKPQVVVWFVLNSFVSVSLAYGLVRWSRRPGQEKLAHYLADSAAGRAVQLAEASLKEIEEFARE